MISNQSVGPFFIVNDAILMETVPVSDAELYGDFMIHPLSHDEIWQSQYRNTYRVDYDYYPRGRVVYNHVNDVFVIYIDRCISEDYVSKIRLAFGLASEYCETAYDEHYQCRNCNKHYVG